MNALDIALAVVLAAFVVFGAVKGLVRLVLGSVALAFGVFLGCWYNAPVAAAMSGWIQSDSVRRLSAFGAIFLATLAGFAVLVWFITKTLEAAHLRWVDRLTGAALGLAIAALLAGAILVPLTAFLPADSTLVGGSTMAPYIQRVSSLVRAVVPADLKQRYDAARKRMAEAGKGILPGGADMPLPPSVPEVLKGIEHLKDPNRTGAPDPNAPKAAPAAGSDGGVRKP